MKIVKIIEFMLTLNATDVQGLCFPNNPSLLRHPHLGAENLNSNEADLEVCSKNEIEKDGNMPKMTCREGGNKRR